VADAMTRVSLENGIGKPEQYVTVHSGMELEPFLNPPVAREAVRTQLGLKQDDVAVGTIARLFYLKGHDDLLELAPSLSARFPNLKFVWIGDGLLKEQFRQRIAQLKLTERFVFTGLVPPTRIPELVSALDIVAHPSRREGLARAIPQGQLARCPVVCYDVDGNAEGLIHGETGYAVRAFDVKAFGESLALLLSDSSLRTRMGAAGRAFSKERFDHHLMVRKLLDVYEGVSPSPSGRGLG
jgi:glycosyltransferase involved in cell wall biosynthesis